MRRVGAVIAALAAVLLALYAVALVIKGVVGDAGDSTPGAVVFSILLLGFSAVAAVIAWTLARH